MEQLKGQSSTQSNNLKLIWLLDAISAKNDLLREDIFVHICYLPATHQCLFLNNDNYGATENNQIIPCATKLTY